MNIAQQENLVPLTPQAAGILLSVANRPLYGYAIRQQIEHDLHLTMSFGSLYPTLNRLERMRLIESAGARKSTSSPNERKLYKITSLGRDVLKMETDRQSQFVGLAKAYNKQP